MVQPTVQLSREKQHRQEIPIPGRKTLPKAPQIQQNLQQELNQTELQLYS